MQCTVRSITITLTLLLISPSAFAKDGGVLLFGGTGRLGAPIAKLLVEAGEDVTVFARKDSPKDRLAGVKVDYVVGDLTDDKSIATAFDVKKYRVAIDASAQRGESSKIDKFYETITRSIVGHAKRTGVKLFIHHGSIGSGENIKQVPYLKDFKQSAGMIDKGKAEQVILEGGVTYVIIRNGLLPVKRDPPATGRGHLTSDLSTFSEVTRDDLAILTVDAMYNPARWNKIYHAIDFDLKERAQNP